MAAGSLTAAALRHRPRQALLIVVLAAVVSASATLGPLYSRAVEQSVLQTVLADAPASASGVVVLATGQRSATPDALAQAVTSGPSPHFGRPIGGADTAITVTLDREAGKPTPTQRPDGTSRLTSRDELCRHLQLSAGSCPTGGADARVVISQRDAASLGVKVGDTLPLTDAAQVNTKVTATVSGIYRPYDASGAYWFDRSAAGVQPVARQGQEILPVLDTVFTSWETITATQWSDRATHIDVPLKRSTVDLDTLADVRAAAADMDDRARAADAVASTGLPGLIASAEAQRSQTRTVVPLLAVQLALLGVVVLGFVCAAATEARRPEVALARLRGLRATGSASLLMRELGAMVLIGVALGAVLGWLVARVAVAQWLAPGVELELRRPVAVAVGGAALAGLLAVAITAVPTLRQPLISLLRRVPPRASAVQVGLIEGALVAVTVAGLVTLLSSSGGASGSAGDSRGPIALLTPGLLAVAGGLLLAQAVVPVSGPLAKRALRRGRLVSALAGIQVARRPALRRLIAIITVAVALLVFAADTWAVADRNRVVRAGVEAGAPVVLTVAAPNVQTLRDAVLDIDPDGRFATPVVTASSATPVGPRTTAVEPAAFARIAQWGSDVARPTSQQLRALVPERVPPIRLTGDRVTLTATTALKGLPRAQGQPPDVPGRLPLVLQVTRFDGQTVRVDVGRLRAGTHTYTGRLPCTGGCLLRRVEVRRVPGDVANVEIDLNVQSLAAGTKGSTPTPADLGPANSPVAWLQVPDSIGSFDEVTVDPFQPLTISGTSFGFPLSVQRGDAPVAPPVLAAGEVDAPRFGSSAIGAAVAPDLSGVSAGYEIAGRLRQVPRSGQRGVLVGLESLVSGAGPPTAQTSYAVWLAADDAGREQAVRSALADHGVVVTSRDSTRAHEQTLSREGPTLALRLALLSGIVALVLAASVLVVGIATSGASRARDLAGLRIVGVPARTVRAAAIYEHVTVALLGVVAGVTLGLLAAQIALPQVPIFAQAGPRLPIVRDPAWGAVGLAALSCLVLLVAVSVLVGRALGALATPARLREGR